MSDQPAKQLDWPMAIKILEDNEQYALSFRGKEGYNPRMYINKVIAPLRQAYNSGDRTETLFNSIIGLKKTEPKAPESTIRVVKPPEPKKLP